MQRAFLATAGHGCGDVFRVFPAISSPDARDAQVLLVVHQRLQNDLRLEEIGDRSYGGAHEHRSYEAH